MKHKRAKLVKKQNLSVQDTAQIEALYKIKAYMVHSAFFSPIIQEKSTLVRVTYAEFDGHLKRNIPVCAVSVTIEDFQRQYEAMTNLLQQMRAMGRIA